MKTINLKNIIAEIDMPDVEIAKRLFPGNRYPKMALTRLMRGESELSASQLLTLSHMTGKDMNELFNLGQSWKTAKNGRLFKFSHQDFTAELDPETWVTKIFHAGTLFHETVISSGATPLSEFFKTLNRIIETQQKQKES